MELLTWGTIDAELDRIEEGDIDALVAVFLTHRNRPLASFGRRERVTVSSFARHIELPRHTFDSYVRLVESSERETA
jgi:hypothetical protein